MKLTRLLALLAFTTTFVWATPPAGASFPGANREIAFTTTADGVKEIHAVDADGLGERTIIARDGLDSIDPAWSASGLTLAFAGEVIEGGPTAIFVADWDGTDVRQVTQGAVDPLPIGSSGDAKPTWAPDGSRIAFQRGLGSSFAIFVVSLATGTVQQLTDGSGPEIEPAWSIAGDEIAFIAGVSVSEDCWTCRRQLFVVPANGGTPTQVGDMPLGFDARNPDWTPPGGGLVIEEVGVDLRGVNRFTGGSGPLYLSSYHPADPASSPEGSDIAFEGSLDGSLYLWIHGQTFPGGTVRLLRANASDPSWRPGSREPAQIYFHPDSGSWLRPGSSIHVEAWEPDQPATIGCTEGGVPAGPESIVIGSDGTLSGTIPVFQSGRLVPIECTVTDRFGSTSSASISVNIDLDLPVATDVTIDPQIVRSDNYAWISATLTDETSGPSRGEATATGLLSGAVSTTSLYGWPTRFSGSFAPGLSPDIYAVSVQPVDIAGNIGRSVGGPSFVVYDPAAGSVAGSGWVVPGGSTSGGSDQIPGLDGKSKASFAFSAKYRTPTDTSPTGFFNLSYGSKFRLSGKTFSWLLVTATNVALLQGTASIQGRSGTFTYRAWIRDGGSAAVDHLAVRIWPSVADPNTTQRTYEVSGDAGGQIQITR